MSKQATTLGPVFVTANDVGSTLLHSAHTPVQQTVVEMSVNLQTTCCTSSSESLPIAATFCDRVFILTRKAFGGHKVKPFGLRLHA